MDARNLSISMKGRINTANIQAKQKQTPPPPQKKTKQNENQIKTNWSKYDFDTPSKQHWKAHLFLIYQTLFPISLSHISNIPLRFN